ncbi:MAG: AAA family ATPase [Gammaproteobacteria bacterium]|nr:AAA family ATPase [Gammaproteobacteria bacterium]
MRPADPLKAQARLDKFVDQFDHAELLNGASPPPPKTPSLRPRRVLVPLVWLSDVAPVLSQAYVVRGLIGSGSAVVIYGDSNSGKTFFALDLCLHIACGQPWRDQRVQAGLVVYVAAEGGHGIRNRLAAYRQQAPWTRGAPFAVLPQTVDLLKPTADTGPLIEMIRAAEETAGAKVAVVVLDTLARVMTGGNENASEDMSAFIANVDRIRAETGAAVIIIHHAGKDATKGARGHSSLRAAADTEILVEGLEGTRTASVQKQRDLPSGQRYGFDLVSVEVGIDPEDGAAVTSCIVAVADAPPKTLKGPSGPRQKDLLRLMESETKAGNAIIPRGKLAKLATDRLGMPRSSANTALDQLADRGYIIATVGGMKLTEAPTP